MISEMNLQINKKMKSHREDKEGLLQCDIDIFTYFFGNHLAVLRLPMYNCTDMTGAIAYCKLVDEYVQKIEVYEGNRLINVYSAKDGEWAVTFLNRYGHVIEA
jgi:hypothetical protein